MACANLTIVRIYTALRTIDCLILMPTRSLDVVAWDSHHTPKDDCSILVATDTYAAEGSEEEISPGFTG